MGYLLGAYTTSIGWGSPSCIGSAAPDVSTKKQHVSPVIDSRWAPGAARGVVIGNSRGETRRSGGAIASMLMSEEDPALATNLSKGSAGPSSSVSCSASWGFVLAALSGIQGEPEATEDRAQVIAALSSCSPCSDTTDQLRRCAAWTPAAIDRLKGWFRVTAPAGGVAATLIGIALIIRGNARPRRLSDHHRPALRRPGDNRACSAKRASARARRQDLRAGDERRQPVLVARRAASTVVRSRIPGLFRAPSTAQAFDGEIAPSD